MRRDLAERFVDDRAALDADELVALAAALTDDAALAQRTRALLAVDELLGRAFRAERAAFAAPAIARPTRAAAPARRASARRRAAPARPWMVGVGSLLAASVALAIWAPIADTAGRVVDATAATVERDGGTIALRASDALRWGDRVRVGDAGAIVFSHRGGTFTGSGAFAFTAPSDRRIALEHGAFAVEAAHRPADRPLVILTPHAEARIVGTSFTLAIDDDGTRLAVSDGTVAFTPTGGATAMITAGGSANAAPRHEPRALDADPTTLRERLAGLRAGDTLTLAPGTYPSIQLSGLHGRDDAWITIAGPASGEPAILAASAHDNTIQIGDAHHVVIRDLRLDGGRIPGPFAISTNSSLPGPVHDIRIERCDVRDYGGWPDAAAISTKRATWNWAITDCRFTGCGTAMAMGSTAGDAPFTNGTIARNLMVVERVGIFLPGHDARTADAPSASITRIHDNVIVRAPGTTAELPLAAIDGCDERVDVARNLFHGNRGGDSLMQASGDIDIHDNIFADGDGLALRIASQARPLRRARIWRNTIVATAGGIRFGDQAAEDDLVCANLIMVDQPLSGPVRNAGANLIIAPHDAAQVVVDPTPRLGALDLHPRPGMCRGESWPVERVADADGADFDGRARPDPLIFGAYGGPARPSDWTLAAERKR
ncbi:MAG TPA: FecR domain-containing protein [Planctomycetota bacterium]|nr:FecR domain-containing protein [Planctomycetota bacterium]